MKEICTPTFLRTNEKYVLKYENTPVAIVYCENVTFGGEGAVCSKISAFYSGMTERFTKWVKGYFEEYAKKAYISDQNPRKRFRYTPFELKYKVNSSIREDNYMDVSVDVLLFKKKKLISEKNIRHTWSLKNGTLRVTKSNK